MSDVPAQNENLRVTTSQKPKFPIYLIILLGVVLLFVISQAAYYLYNRRLLENSLPPSNQESLTDNSETEEQTDSQDKISRVISNLKIYQKNGDFIKAATIAMEIQGSVLSNQPYNKKFDGEAVAHNLLISDQNNNQISVIILEKELPTAITLLASPDGTTKRIDISEISGGDYIKIQNIDNLLDPGINASLTITVTKTN